MLLLTKRSARATLAERIVFAGFLLLLALVPLPFGADRPWAWSLFAISTGGLLVCWGILAARSRSYQAASIRPLLPAVGLFVLVVLWVAVQASGLVPPEWRHPLWSATEAALGKPVGGGVSLDEHRTWTAMMRLMCYGGVFLLSFQLCLSTDRSERLIRMLIGMTLTYACYGLFVQSAGIDKVLWYAKAEGAGHLSSTFLDPNAFAAYAGLGLLCALALLFRPTMRRGDLQTGWRFTTRALADFFFARTWTMILGVSVLFAAVLMTHSRAGLAPLGAGAYLAVMAWVRQRKIVSVVAVAVMAVAVSSLLAIAGGPGAAPNAAIERGEAYARTVNAITAAPLLETGYGTRPHRRHDWRRRSQSSVRWCPQHVSRERAGDRHSGDRRPCAVDRLDSTDLLFVRAASSPRGVPAVPRCCRHGACRRTWRRRFRNSDSGGGRDLRGDHGRGLRPGVPARDTRAPNRRAPRRLISDGVERNPWAVVSICELWH